MSVGTRKSDSGATPSARTPSRRGNVGETIGYLGNDDPTTRRMLQGILAMEEEHADDLVSLLEELGNG